MLSQYRLAVLASRLHDNHLLELLCRFKEILFRLTPIAYVIGVIRTVEYTFQATEALIDAQYAFLSFGGFTAFFFQTQHDTDSLRVGLQDFFLIVCHKV